MSLAVYAPSITVGEIVTVQKPTSGSDTITKYIVRVETENATTTFVSNVVASTFIGGVADGLKVYKRASLANDKPYKVDDKNKFGIGDRVIVAFINNDLRRGIIIGGYNRIIDYVELPEPDEEKPQMRFQYLGMVFDIDTKGQFTITHTGAPKITDSPDDVPEIDEKKVSILKFKDDSSFFFVDANKQSIVVDAANKKIEFSSDKEKVSIDQKGTIKVESTKEVIVKAPKIALGTSSTELLDLIDKLLEALQKSAPQLVQTAVGPGAMDPNLISAVADIKTKISQIKGKID